MSEFMPEDEMEERRSGRSRDIEIISLRQAEWLSEALIPNPSEASIFQNGFQIKQVSDEKLYCAFPGKIISDQRRDVHTLLFDQPTVEHLIDTFAQSYKVTESEITELYIGTTIAAHLLFSRIREQNTVRVKRMNNELTDVNGILLAMRTTETIFGEKRWDAIQSIMQSDDKRIGNINVLRFAFGMVYLQPDDYTYISGKRGKLPEPRESRMMMLFRDGLMETIQNKPTYQKVGEFFGRNVILSSDEEIEPSATFEQEPSFLGDKVFADAMGEFELAACFPMQWPELANILKICK
jgi:hypothetical protein